MRTIVITGASSGIGLATAEEFVNFGEKVINLDIAACPNPKIKTIICDVSNESQVKRAIASIPRIDVLVCSAGIFGCYDIENTPAKFLDKIVNVNMKGNFLVSKYALVKLRKSRGNVVFVSSGIGINADPSCAAYCMTKASINMFVRCLALTEINNGVRVNAVLPGPIKTPLLDEWFETEQELSEYAKLNPQNKIGSPKDVANAIVFLAKEDNSYINGAFLAVDGGESISSILPKKVRRKK